MKRSFLIALLSLLTALATTYAATKGTANNRGHVANNTPASDTGNTNNIGTNNAAGNTGGGTGGTGTGTVANDTGNNTAAGGSTNANANPNPNTGAGNTGGTGAGNTGDTGGTGNDTGNTPGGITGGTGGANNKNNNDGRGKIGGNRSTDTQFLRLSAQLALMEITMAHLALSNSQNAAILQFAQDLLEDHTNQLQQLQTVADELGFTLPTTLSPRDQANAARVSGLTGDAFDREWTRLMVSSHNTSLTLHQRVAQRSRSESVRAYARAQLLPLATHLATALEIHEQYRTSADNRGKRGRVR